MSRRVLQRIYGDPNKLPEPTSDTEFEPLYAAKSVSYTRYQGLEISSDSDYGVEEEQQTQEASEEENEQKNEIVGKSKKKKNKKSKNANKKTNISKEVPDNLDEIDRSVMEVNKMLGDMPVKTGQAGASTSKASNGNAPHVFNVEQKHLNFANEMKRRFGPDESDIQKRGHQANAYLFTKKALIVPKMMELVARFKRNGLSMSKNRRVDGFTYFTYDHNKEYRRQHHKFIEYFTVKDAADLLPLDNDTDHVVHVETLLETANVRFRMDDHGSGYNLIEQVIAYMQYVAHPLFSITDRKTRLEYRYMENRTFHIAVLKYIHLLTNRACHRTALELAKVLLNLDPSDPLAVVLIIDMLALRAREHEWLIEAVAHMDKERQAMFLFNIQYSNALAHFHVATKNNENLDKSDELLQKAIHRFPSVVMQIFNFASASPTAKIKSSPLYTFVADVTISKSLKGLISMYAKFTHAKWEEPPVLAWLIRNAEDLARKYEEDAELKASICKLSNERLALFRKMPLEVKRHLIIIEPLSTLIADGAIPVLSTVIHEFDPLPPTNTINRYRYNIPGIQNQQQSTQTFPGLHPNVAG